MGRTNPIIYPFYDHFVKPSGVTALLGFTENDLFDGDLYDLQLNNWNINSEWKLEKKYDTIISLRCPYFAQDPKTFIKQCYQNLNDGGKLYVDWALGDHWRFDNYKIGWLKNEEQEHHYGEENFLWSTIWDDSFLKNEQYLLFCERVKKFGYADVKKAIFEEVPKILMLDEVKKYFNVEYNIITLWEDLPQLYILLSCQRKKIE